MTTVGRYTVDELHAMAARVRESWPGPPPGVPLLGEDEEQQAPETCGRGHSEWTTQHGGKRRCRACARERQRERRARG